MLKDYSKYIYGLLSAICYGAFTTLGKLSMLELNSQTIVTLRFGLLIITILIATLLFKNLGYLKIKRKDMPLMIFTGAILTVETLLFWLGFSLSLTIIPFLALYWSFPIMNLILDIVSGDMKLYWKPVLLIGIGIIGVILGTGGISF